MTYHDTELSLFIDFAGLFRGVVPTVQRAALLTATQLGTYDEIKQTLLRGGFFREGPLLHFCSGSVAGLGVAFVTSPVDTIRTRWVKFSYSVSFLSFVIIYDLFAPCHSIMNQPIDTATGKGALYRHSLDCLVKTIRTEGFFAIYKGFFAQWLR